MDKAQVQETLTQLKFLAGDGTQLEAAAQCVLLVHAVNLANKSLGLRCTGVLEDDVEEANAQFELPPTWNNSLGGVYSLRYRTHDNKLCLFKFIKMGNLLNINCSYNDELYSVTLNTAQIDYNNVNSAQNNDFLKQYEQEVLSKFLPPKEEEKKKPVSEEQAQDFFWNANNRNPQPLYIGPSSSQQQQQQRIPPPNAPFGDYGRSDLDPFANRGPQLGGNTQTGGNLMGPNNPIFAQRGDTGNLLATDPRHFRYDPQALVSILNQTMTCFYLPGQPRTQPKMPPFGGAPGFGLPRGGGGGGRGNFPF